MNAFELYSAIHETIAESESLARELQPSAIKLAEAHRSLGRAEALVWATTSGSNNSRAQAVDGECAVESAEVDALEVIHQATTMALKAKMAALSALQTMKNIVELDARGGGAG